MYYFSWCVCKFAKAEFLLANDILSLSYSLCYNISFFIFKCRFFTLSFCSKLILIYSFMPYWSKIGLFIWEFDRIDLSIFLKLSLKFQTIFEKSSVLLDSASYLFRLFFQQSRRYAALLSSTSLVRFLPRFYIFSYLALF